MTAPPPPPPPPHGSRQGGRNGLPDGSYDIFIVPPHSSGGGFVYFPSLQTNRNSFLAGVASALFGVTVYAIVLPVLRDWMSAVAAGGGFSVILLLLAAAVAGWAWGKTQVETMGQAPGNPGSAPQPGSTGQHHAGPNPGFTSGFTPRPEPRPPPSWQRSNAGPGAGVFGTDSTSAKGAWEKARDETRKKEEERKKAEDAKKQREEDEKERVRTRDREAREREARERREKDEAAKNARPSSPRKTHLFPTAKTATDDASSYSYRPYDKPSRNGYKPASASSIYSESSYASSISTSKTTPPPSERGPYRCKDPNKIVIKAVYSYNNAFVRTPIAKLISGMGSVTDGLILRITTEGLFIDDDVRGVPQREWDVKAWTLKLIETGEENGFHVVRASIRDAEGKRYVFVLPREESWKVATGLQNLRRGSQVRALAFSGMPKNETVAILQTTGFL